LRPFLWVKLQPYGSCANQLDARHVRVPVTDEKPGIRVQPMDGCILQSEAESLAFWGPFIMNRTDTNDVIRRLNPIEKQQLSIC
jgi:hypothetical protein